MSEAKSCQKQNEVNQIEAPCFQEISVKNLYAEAMKDELIVKYLFSKKQFS